MKVLMLLLGILLLAGASVLTYLLYDHNKSDADVLQIVLYSIVILIALILSVLCFINAFAKQNRARKKGSKFRM
jgi:hypothetical protein